MEEPVQWQAIWMDRQAGIGLVVGTSIRITLNVSPPCAECLQLEDEIG